MGFVFYCKWLRSDPMFIFIKLLCLVWMLSRNLKIRSIVSVFFLMFISCLLAQIEWIDQTEIRSTKISRKVKRKRRGIEIRIYGKDTRRESNKMNTTRKKTTTTKATAETATAIRNNNNRKTPHNRSNSNTNDGEKNIYICISLNSAVCL